MTPLSLLTSRQRDVAILRACGLTDKDIEARLGIAQRTVRLNVQEARLRLHLGHK